MRRTERLFALAEALRAHRGGITVAALAQRFGVTERTIHRDLVSLRAADLPVRGEPGRGGGLALDRTYTLPPVNFTAREAALLVAAGEWLAASRILPFTETLRGALDKVRAALPRQGRAGWSGCARRWPSRGCRPSRRRWPCARWSSRPCSRAARCASSTASAPSTCPRGGASACARW
ncbi:MAG: HTH domain-containing protein [bacterium]